MAVIFNQNDPNNPSNQSAPAPSAPQAPPTSSTGAPLQTIGTAAPVAGNAPRTPPQGSGRFTNLQKYLQANQKGGQQIAGQIGSNLDKQNTQQSEKAKNYYNQLGQTIDQSNQTAQAGQAYNKQLQGIGTQVGQNTIGAADSQGYKDWLAKLNNPSSQDGSKLQTNGTMIDKSGNTVPIPTNQVDPGYYRQNPVPAAPLTPEEQYSKYQQEMLGQRPQQDFSNLTNFATGSVEGNPNRQLSMEDFQDIQAGRGINEGLLSLQQQKAAAAAQAAAQGSTQAQQALGNESGRFDLLRKSFGGDGRTGYTQGQQRLDQVLLGQGGGLGGLQAQTAQQNRANLEQSKLAAAKSGDVNRLTAQEQGLIGDIGSQSAANEKAYMDMLQSYIDPLNTQRTQEFEGLNTAVGAYAGTPEAQQQWATGQTTGFTPEQMARLGLTGANTGVYNVFKGPGGVSAAQDIAEQGRQAQNAQDVANQSDVNRYAALSKIMGQNAPQNITQAADLGDTYTAKTGEAGLKERLAAAQTQFDTNLQNKTYSPGQGYNYNIYGNDIINRGRYGFEQSTNLGGGPRRRESIPNLINMVQDRYKGSQRTALNNAVKQFQDFINQQNYNQTLGGQRQTFLDTEAAAKLAAQGGIPKLDQTPITEVDPNIAYMNALKGLKGS